MRKTPLSLSIMLIGLGAAVVSGGAMASGYHFGTQSVSSQGTANASGVEANDATVIFSNPAGLSHVKGTTASAVLDIVIPEASFTDKGSRTLLGKPTGGGDGGKFASTTAVPHFFLSHQISDKVTFGLGTFVPFGSHTKYDDNWVGRYNVKETDLKTLAINPSVAFKLTDSITLGGGVTAQYIEGKLTKSADFGSGAVAALARAGQISAAQAAALTPVMSGNPTYDGSVVVKGDDWGYGYNLGLMFELDAGTRFGIAYRSAIKHELAGTADWTVPQSLATSPLGAAGALVLADLNGRYVDSGASLNIDTPESFSISAYKQIGDKAALMADITRTRHSRFKELRIDFHSTLADSNTPENWSDTTKVSFGGTYRLSDALLLRAGISYDRSPVTDQNRTPSIPDNDRKWFSLGGNWAINKDSSLDFAYSFVKLNKSTINTFDNGGVTDKDGKPTCDSTRNTSSCATIVGEYDVKSSIIGIQYNYRF
ncbi:OmpP1/FadL family transporter [Parachitinimonas caeni]|uniref:OmpP1/FadL family transporter n=1 Tax=Parachitinimonas caeni TaxID=3031301 RepID=A0ABT7DYS0_9NEIS|nr:OmpP1/FadL family transporter [Parachitinimonas caeni]MDK2125208.1 OmpP1/FadL family transporter [Parachitinimonas caeni]